MGMFFVEWANDLYAKSSDNRARALRKCGAALGIAGDHCYDFGNIFAEKIGEEMGAFE
jgi:hypothetical protein